MRFTPAVCLSIVKILDINRKKDREAGLFFLSIKKLSNT